MRTSLALITTLTFFGCGGGPDPDGDAGRDPDAGNDRDVGVGDPDAGPSDGGDAGSDAGPLVQHNIVFVTSTTTTGAMGGRDGADGICNTLAAAAGLDGTYVAWLSTTTSDAIDRLEGASGWVRVDGQPFADTPEDIAAGRIYYPIRIDEQGVEIPLDPSAFVFTGTQGTGLYSTLPTCGEWTLESAEQATAGNAGGGSQRWTSSTGAACDDARRLYCFGVDLDSGPVVREAVTERRAFLTSEYFTVGGGLAGADAQCQAEAAAAGLTEDDGSGRSRSFRAMLAANGATAGSRFDLTMGPWQRVDGVRIVTTAAQLFSSSPLDAPINLTADGAQYDTGQQAWVGVPHPGLFEMPGTADTTCESWTSNDAADTGNGGFTNLSDRPSHTLASMSPCSGSPRRLICLEE